MSAYPTADTLIAMAKDFPHPMPGMVMTHTYTDEADGQNLIGYMAVPLGMASPPPLVLITPDWDGINDYEKDRAELFAMAG